MILQSLDEPIPHHLVSERVRKALDFLRTVSQSTPDGKYEVEGKNIFVLVMSPMTDFADKRTYEAHKLYIDIHFVIEGEQVVYWRPLLLLSAKGYIEADEAYSFPDNPLGTPLHLSGRNFVIFYPEDAHKTQCVVNQPERIKVCVMKVKV